MSTPQAPSPAPERTTDSRVVLLMMAFAIPAALSVWLVLDGRAKDGPMTTNSALGLLGLVIVAALLLSVMLVTRAMQSARGGGGTEEIADLTRHVERLASQTSLSDDARRVLNRARERDMLRKAIEEDISRGDYEAAMVLVKELAERFGYRADAEEFRQRIDMLRHESLDKKVREAIGLLDGLIIQRRWDDAFAESGKIQRLYPDSHRTEGLRNRVEQARAAYKFDLERAFFIAIREDRNHEALEVFKELDPYLTTAETELYRETVKGVIGKARENLGVQFKLAVQDRRWAEASRVGEQIVHEFPNTRMAAEVRSLIDTIRTKAAGLAS